LILNSGIKSLNKFAPLVFVLLLSCGAALWFLASDSLNFHIKNQIQNIGTELSQQNVTVENVSILGYQGTGTISNLLISHAKPKDLLATDKSTLSITSIDLVIDHESLKKEVVIIESITIQGLNASFYYNENGTSLENLLKTVQENIDKLAVQEKNTEQEQQNKITPPLMKVSNVFIKEGTLHLINDKNKHVTTKFISEIELEFISDELGNKGENIGIELFKKLLIALNKQASMLKNQ
jgi:hypothetical protein